MRNVQNDYMRIQLQNALMAQQVGEASKARQAEKARELAAEEIAKAKDGDTENLVKRVDPKKEGENNSQEPPKDFRKFRYKPDGTLEDEGGSSFASHINIKA